MVMRVIFVVLSVHALIRVAPGVAAPTAPDMLMTSAPAASSVNGLRSRPIEIGSEAICALSMLDPPRENDETKKSPVPGIVGVLVRSRDGSNGLRPAVPLSNRASV
jgi:hypothetical protein